MSGNNLSGSLSLSFSLLLLFFLAGCQTHSAFYLIRRVPLPRTTGETGEKQEVRDLYYLLPSEFETQKNQETIDLALAGDWSTAKDRWQSLHARMESEDSADCGLTNNLGLSHILNRDPRKALQYLALALSQCQDHPEIRWNYRQQLRRSSLPTPHYSAAILRKLYSATEGPPRGSSSPWDTAGGRYPPFRAAVESPWV